MSGAAGALIAALLASTCLTHAGAEAADASTRPILKSAPAGEPKWGAHLDLEGKWGNRRSLGDIGLFVPLWQSPTSLFFTDIRGRLDDRDSREGNFGFGLRHMLPSGWNAGVYGYYDARRTGNGNFFQQATLGAELLSPDFDLRVNGYLPFGKREYGVGGAGGAPFAEFANGTIEIVTPGGGFVERALRGFDAEIGWRLPVFSVDSFTQIRAYAGGFWFDGEGFIQDIAGPRGRIELSFEQPSGPWAGSRLTLGAEVQHDEVRGTNAFAVARLRIPLQPVERSARRLTPQESRMTERVVRDVDIVAGQGNKSATAETREAAINVYNNETVTDVVQVTDETGMDAALAGGAAGRVVILNGSISGLNNSTTVAVGKTLLGGGTQLPLTGAVTGSHAVFTAPGAAGSLSGTVPVSNGIVHLQSNGVAGGLTIENAAASVAPAIVANGADGVTVFGNTVSTTGSSGGVDANHGIHIFNGSDNAKVIGNTVTTVSDFSHGIFINNSANATATGNTLSASGTSNGIWFFGAANGTATSNTVTTAGVYGVLFEAGSNGGTANNNIVQNAGIGLAAQGSTGIVVAGNIFGPSITSSVLFASASASFISANSTGNIDNSAPFTRCDGDGTATGTVSFTTAPNCVYP